MTKTETIQVASLTICCFVAVVMLARGFGFAACNQWDQGIASTLWSMAFSAFGFAQIEIFKALDRRSGR